MDQYCQQEVVVRLANDTPMQLFRARLRITGVTLVPNRRVRYAASCTQLLSLTLELQVRLSSQVDGRPAIGSLIHG